MTVKPSTHVWLVSDWTASSATCGACWCSSRVVYFSVVTISKRDHLTSAASRVLFACGGTIKIVPSWRHDGGAANNAKDRPPNEIKWAERFNTYFFTAMLTCSKGGSPMGFKDILPRQALCLGGIWWVFWRHFLNVSCLFSGEDRFRFPVSPKLLPACIVIPSIGV